MKRAKITSRILSMSTNGDFCHGVLAPHLARTPRAMRMNVVNQIKKHMEKCDRQRNRGYAKGIRTPRVTRGKKVTAADMTFLAACGIAY